MRRCSASLGIVVAQLLSRVQLSCTAMDCCLPGSSVHGIPQARILEWVAITFSGRSSPTGIEPAFPALAGRFFTAETPGKSHQSLGKCKVKPQLDYHFIPIRISPFSSLTQSCLTLCDPMNRSTPGLPVRHQLPEFTQTHAHQVSDAIQPPHPLSSPSPPAPNPSQHQGLFQ